MTKSMRKSATASWTCRSIAPIARPAAPCRLEVLELRSLCVDDQCGSDRGSRDAPRPIAPAYREAAVLVEMLVIRDQDVERMPRTQPHVLPVGVRRLPVLHVEAASDEPDTLSDAQVGDIVAAFMRRVDEAAAGAGILQLDFDVPRRERASYRALVARLRAALPPQLKLSATALAHWCSESDWLDRLPVDEVVPMLYRLGPQATRWRSQWLRGDATLAARCRGPALGFATDDPPPAELPARTSRHCWACPRCRPMPSPSTRATCPRPCARAMSRQSPGRRTASRIRTAGSGSRARDSAGHRSMSPTV